MEQMADAAPPFDAQSLAAHREALTRLAAAILRDPHTAEDVVQDAYVAAIRRPPPDGARAVPWFAGVVRHLALSRLRADARRRRHELAAVRGGADSPADAVERVEAHRRVVEAVLSLVEPYRTTVVLRYFEELSSAEIARRTGVPHATVRTHLSRGLAQLRERLGADEPD